MRYTYSFAVWPDEKHGFQSATIKLFGMLAGRVEMDFTAEEFGAFQASLKRDGITLREVERWPYHEPESVR